jgi:hypothetical protein
MLFSVFKAILGFTNQHPGAKRTDYNLPKHNARPVSKKTPAADQSDFFVLEIYGGSMSAPISMSAPPLKARLERAARSTQHGPVSPRSRPVLAPVRSGRVSRCPRLGRARAPVSFSPRFGVGGALLREKEVRVTRRLGNEDRVVGSARLLARRVSRYGLEALPRNQGHATGGRAVQRERGHVDAFFARPKTARRQATRRDSAIPSRPPLSVFVVVRARRGHIAGRPVPADSRPR